MLRISKLTDYGIMLLTYMAREPTLLTYSAPELAARSHLPLPTVSKLLKTLVRRGVLNAQRGAKGGFRLARRPEDISVAEIIHVLEGPIALTECSMHPRGQCGIERLCPVRNQWQQINRVVHEALERLTLAAMTHPLPRKLAIFGDQEKQSEPRSEQ